MRTPTTTASRRGGRRHLRLRRRGRRPASRPRPPPRRRAGRHRGLTHAETATVMGVPVGTVTSRIHRARRRSRDRPAHAGLAPRSNR
ncbi:MAG: sigma factor-like helix-turn-helix DNA-binding protein [Acidimicrobiales bacterium]